MHPIVNIAIRAARAAGDVIVRHLDRLDTLTIEEKGRNDLVSEVDREAERRIIGVVHRAYPDHAVLAEESGARAGTEYEWVIDPLDGTKNYLHGLPHFAVSIAVRRGTRVDHGVVLDPVRNELFVASRGAGARLDDRRIRVAPRNNLDGALIGTGFPFREMDNLEAYLEMLRALMPRCGGVRRAGAAALDLAYVASGRLDGFWEFGLAPWDMAAGALLVREAGGLVSDPHGGEAFMDSGDIVAASPKVLRAMLQHIEPIARRTARP